MIQILPETNTDSLYRLLNREINSSLEKGALIASVMGFSVAIAILFINIMKPFLNLWLPAFSGIVVGFYALFVLIASNKMMVSNKKACWIITPLVFVNFTTILASYFFKPEEITPYIIGPGAYGNFIVIIISGFVFSYRFSYITGILAGSMYIVSYFLAREQLLTVSSSVDMITQLIQSSIPYIFKGFLMIVGGFLVGNLSKTSRKLIMQILKEESDKNFITNTFGMIVDPRVRDQMIEGKIELGGETRIVTVLFADIRGFTTFSQKMSPKELLHFMKEYFDLMNAEIKSEDGTILEYVGDEIMVLFGAPLKIEKHAEKACRAALKMQKALKKQCSIWLDEGKPHFHIGIGVHTGPMLVGNIGSSERYKYGAIGDNVNLGSRIQELTKTYGLKAIASEDTVNELNRRFHTREIERVKVRGRTEDVTIYEIIADSDETLEEEKAEFLNIYRNALSLYRSGDLHQSLQLFNKCLKINSDDKPSKLFVEKITIDIALFEN